MTDALLDDDDQPQPFNDGHLIEAQDRCDIVLMMVAELLDRHPAVLKAGVQTQVDQACAALQDAYQKIIDLEHPAEGKGALYTCEGRGGEYELLGESIGAGTSNGQRVMVYYDTLSGQLYHRTTENFERRMQPLQRDLAGDA